MNQERNSLRVGAAVVASAVVLRLAAGGALDTLGRILTSPETVAVLMYLETGRVIRTYDTMTYPVESPIPEATEASPPAEDAVLPEIPVFTAEDLKRVEVDYSCSYDPDLQTLLTAPLDWDLTSDDPAVLILHTHTTESYTPSAGEEYTETSAYRTLDEEYNMLSIGDAVAQKLEAAGIGVIHDRQFHDYPSYNGSYSDARTAMESILAEHPSVRVILDLHRDAADVNGGQMDTSAQVNGREAAQLMIVVGTDASGLYHPNWQENLSLALKLQAQLEGIYPCLCRPIDLRSQRFNGDESPGALLVEVGAAGNTHQEALTAAEALADGMIALAHGANLTADSTS